MDRRHFLASMFAAAVAPPLRGKSEKQKLLDLIVECGQTLDKNNVPQEERWIILSPQMAAYFGEVKGIKIYESRCV